jgi:hypothetical protein
MEQLATRYDQLGSLLTLLLYLAFFAWTGLRRGALREGIVLATGISVFALLSNPRISGLVVTITNLVPKFIYFARNGGLSSDPATQDAAVASLKDAPAWVDKASPAAFLFIIGALLLLLVYWLTNYLKGGRGATGWAILLGVLNGVIFAAIFVPRLYSIFFGGATSAVTNVITDITATPAPPAASTSGAGLERVGDVLNGGLGQLSQTLGGLWTVMAPQRALVMLLLLTLFLWWVISTIGEGSKKKKA